MLEINLQKIKFWGIIALIQIGSFGLGFYSASTFRSATPKQSLQPDYTTNQGKDPVNTKPQIATNPPDQATEDCPVKGNISSKSKIYHVKGGSFYDRTDPEMCFNTEAEAQAAGFTKSSR
jgi:hypothetical protein